MTPAPTTVTFTVKSLCVTADPLRRIAEAGRREYGKPASRRFAIRACFGERLALEPEVHPHFDASRLRRRRGAAEELRLQVADVIQIVDAVEQVVGADPHLGAETPLATAERVAAATAGAAAARPTGAALTKLRRGAAREITRGRHALGLAVPACRLPALRVAAAGIAALAALAGAGSAARAAALGGAQRAEREIAAQAQAHVEARTAARGVAAHALRTIIDDAVAVVVAAGRDVVGRRRLRLRLEVETGADEERHVDHRLHAVTHVLERRPPLVVGIEAVGRERRGAVGVVLQLAERVIAAHEDPLLRHAVVEVQGQAIAR